jgi:hypothetical protein
MDRNVEIANALTAILLHAESIRRRAKQDQTEVGASAAHIILNAKRVWRTLTVAAG